jgi:zinc protease
MIPAGHRARVIVLAALAGSGLVAAQTADRPRNRPTAPTLPQVQTHALSSGLPVWIAEYHDLAVVQVSLVVRAGTGDDPQGQYGIASLTAQMLTEGAGSRSASELADAVDAVGANLTASSGIDASVIRLHVPTPALGEALPLMADVALQPAFAEDALDRLRTQRLTTLRLARDDADAIASLALTHAIYGPAHRYATALMGTAAAIESIDADDLRAFHQSAYRPERSAIIVAGDVRPDTVLPLLEASFGAWRPAGAPTVFKPLPDAPPPTRQIVLVDKPNAPQVQIRLGSVAAARSTPDYYAIQVMSTVLAARFNARVSASQRENRVSISGARSGFDLRRAPGPFVMAAAVREDQTAAALKELLSEVEGMTQAVRPGELVDAKAEVARRIPPTYETTDRISSRLDSIEPLVIYRLGETYYSKSADAIQAVTSADVLKAARQYLQPERLTVVVVGDRRAVEPQVRGLALGSIREMTIDQVFE